MGRTVRPIVTFQREMQRAWCVDEECRKTAYLLIGYLGEVCSSLMVLRSCVRRASLSLLHIPAVVPSTKDLLDLPQLMCTW